MLASEVMDQSAAMLNDTALDQYTYTVQIPYLKKANEDLEKKLIIFGTEVQRTKSNAISILADATTVTLPSDFLLPISLKERNVGENNDQWVDMTETIWEPDSTHTTYIEFWAFRNNTIYIKPPIIAKEILLYYERSLAVLSGQNSAVDTGIIKGYLAARTAELCARYIGMNSTFADEIRDNEVSRAESDLEYMLVLNSQGNPVRRPKFTTMRIGVN